MRRELYRRVRLASREAVLDAGCGDGAITEEMAEICKGRVTGVDADPEMVQAAVERKGRAVFRQASASSIPFDPASFDLVTCHWLMLWLPEPLDALKEFRRVLKPGGAILIACEPDYGGRMVFPEDAELKYELISVLSEQGADPLIGRKLPGLLKSSGFSSIRSGLYPGVWDSDSSQDRLKQEQDWLRVMLAEKVKSARLESALASLDQAPLQGSLVMHNPVFWAIGAVT